MGKILNFITGLVIFIFALSGIQVSVSAQENYVFTHLSMEDGLSADAVFNLFEDSKGYIWMATTNGLNCYDGAHIREWIHDPGDSTSIAFNSVRSVFEDQEGYIWIGSRDGKICRYDRYSDRFELFFLPGPSNVNPIWEFYQDQNGTLWVAAHQQIYYLKKGGHQFERIEPGGLNLSYYQPFSIAHSYKTPGVLWLGCRSRFMLQLDIHTYRLDTIRPSFSGDIGSTGDLLAHSNGNLYSFTSPRYIVEFDPAHRTFRRWELDGEYNRSSAQVCEMPDGGLWIATRSFGLGELDLHTGTFRYIRHRSDLLHSIAPGSNYALLRDRHGDLWIGGEESGVSKLEWSARFFRHYFLPRTLADDEDLFVWDVVEIPDGQLLVATENGDGLYWIAGDGMVIGSSRSRRQIGQGARLSIYDIEERQPGTYYLATNQGVLSYTLHRQALQQVKGIPSNAVVRRLRTLANGEIWGTYSGGRDTSGIFCIQLEGNASLFPITKEQTQALPQPPRLTWSYFVPDELRQVIWLGNLQWRGFFDLREKKTYLDYQMRFPFPMSGIEVRAATMIPDAGLVFSYLASGIDIVDTGFGVKNLRRSDGLPGDMMGSVVGDAVGDWWLTSNVGLCRWSRQTNDFQSFTAKDGLYRSNLNFKLRDALIPLGTEKIVIGGYGYFTVFQPNIMKTTAAASRVTIVGWELLPDITPRRFANWHGRAIALSHDQNYFALYFSAMNYVRPDKIRYRFRLAGFEKDWNYSSEGKATYLKVPPGHYTFEVQATNSDGTWNEAMAHMAIEVAPPWWQTRWFWSISALLLLFMLWHLYQYRLKVVRREAQVEAEFKQKLAEMEMQALRSQMNPHFIFNSLNSIKSYIARNERRAATDYLSKFAHLIRLILSHSKASAIPLYGELEALRLYVEMEKMRFGDKFSFVISVPPALDITSILVPPLVLQPFVENAIWHGLMPLEYSGLLEVNISHTEENLIVVIDDNGIGREQAARLNEQKVNRHKSYGLTITEERLLHFYGSQMLLQFEDKKTPEGSAAGTKVTLILPLNPVN